MVPDHDVVAFGFETIRKHLGALMGVSANDVVASTHAQDVAIAALNKLGPKLYRSTTTDTHWYLADLDEAINQANAGSMVQIARLFRAMRMDGVVSGMLSACMDGLVGLPKSFVGDEEQVAMLRGRDAFSLFDSMLPPAELALLAADGHVLGVGIGQLAPVPGRDYPVLVRLDPEFLVYRWHEGQWYYRSMGGDLPITPGNGRWVLHVPGGRAQPWQHGKLYALASAWIPKNHAQIYRSNWEAKLANPARVAESPAGASEQEINNWFQQVAAWSLNTVFALTPGYSVKLLESNGRGYESFAQTIENSDKQIIIALAGQLVTTTGGTGFANADIHKSIRADIIKSVADSLAYTVNTQCIAPWAVANWGVDSLPNQARVSWDVMPPRDRETEGKSLQALAKGIADLTAELGRPSRKPDIDALLRAANIPYTVLDAPVTPPLPLEVTPTAMSSSVRLNELRLRYGLKVATLPNGSPDPEGDRWLREHDLAIEAKYDPTKASVPTPGDPDASVAPTGELTLADVDEDGDGDTNEPVTLPFARKIARDLTKLNARKCPHNRTNRCPFCGVLHYYDDLTVDENGTTSGVNKWVAIDDATEEEIDKATEAEATS